MSDGSGLKVDGDADWSRKCLLLLEEQTAFVVRHVDRLCIKHLELASDSLGKRPLCWTILVLVRLSG